jgi:toxin ParE1/3/4
LDCRSEPDASPLVCDGAPAPVEALSDVRRGSHEFRVMNISAFAGDLMGDYSIFYRVLSDTVEILHMLHGARDYEPILFPASESCGLRNGNSCVYRGSSLVRLTERIRFPR